MTTYGTDHACGSLGHRCGCEVCQLRKELVVARCDRDMLQEELRRLRAQPDPIVPKIMYYMGEKLETLYEEAMKYRASKNVPESYGDTMIAHVAEVEYDEGAMWHPWPFHRWIKPTNSELLTHDLGKPWWQWTAKYSGVKITFHALKLSDGAIWDTINGFRDPKDRCQH